MSDRSTATSAAGADGSWRVADLPPEIVAVLELARWAPSGDNTQPWRFEVVDAHHLRVHGHDTRDWCVYDLDGRASQLALGASLENIAIAATAMGRRATFRILDTGSERDPCIETVLHADTEVVRDPLVDLIRHRVTQRRPMSTAALTPVQRRRLAAALGDDFEVHWVEGRSGRWRMARLLSESARIRLTIPEAYRVHRRIIAWGADHSDDRIPDRAIGLDPLGLRLMHWAMHSWQRVDRLNRWLGGTWLPRLQLDLLPGLLCGAHFLISARSGRPGLEGQLAAGRALQRFWLTATQQGLQLQPEMTPLIFSRYAREDLEFSLDRSACAAAARLAPTLGGLFGEAALADGVFMGRIGVGKAPSARSTRLPLDVLLTR